MARLAGYSGEVTVAGGTVTGIKGWKVDYVFDALESTAFDNTGTRAFVPGLKGWSGSFEGFKDGAPLTIGTEVALVLKESQTATQKYTGQAIINGLHQATTVDGLVTAGYDFQGTGSLVIATT